MRVTPGAKVSAWAGRMPDGRRRVKIAAPAIEGRANAALVRFVATALGLPQRAVRVARGESGRDKTLDVELPAADLEARLAALDGDKVDGGQVDDDKESG